MPLITSIIFLLILSYWIYQNLEFLPNKTFTGKTLIGYYIHYKDKKFHFHFYLPFRNKGKAELKEEIKYLKQLDKPVLIQRLKNKARSINTSDELDRFISNYKQLAPEEVNLIAKETPR